MRLLGTGGARLDCYRWIGAWRWLPSIGLLRPGIRIIWGTWTWMIDKPRLGEED